MKNKLVYILSIFLLCNFFANAQTTDFGGEFSGEYSYKFPFNMQVSVGEKLSFYQDFSHYGRSETSLGISYPLLLEDLKLGVSYCFINKYTKDHYYENRNRLNVNLSFSKKIQKFKFSYRLRYQTTFRDEDRFDVKYNPQMYLRNRLGLSYKLNKRYQLQLSGELYYRLNHPEKRIFDEVRTTLGLQYKINKHNELTFYTRMQKEIQVKKPDTRYLFGIAYSFD